MNVRLPLAATSAPGSAAEADSSKRLAGLLLELARCVNPDVAATVPSRLDADPRLEAMRGVLLEREQAALARLQQRFDDPREFADAVGAVLPAAFALAASQDDNLGQAIAPTVERAAQASIRKNPGTFVDILYPVMGPAIRKAIAQTLDDTLQSINLSLKHSLSWRGLKWRMEAWRSGSSFADVVLRHTAVFRVEHLFLVHRKAGLLLAHVAAEDATTRDPQLVSAMLSAIQDFVRDSFDESATGGSGGAQHRQPAPGRPAAVVRGRSVGLPRRGDPRQSACNAARASRRDAGEHPRRMAQRARRHSKATPRLSPKPSRGCGRCLLSQDAEAQKKFSPLLWAIPLTLLVAVGYWIAQRTIEHRRVDAYVAALREQPGIVVMGAERHDGKWLVSGLRDPLATQPSDLLAQAKLDPARIVERWEPYQALHPAIVLKRMQATVSPPPTISLSQDADGVRASGSAPQHWMDKARAFAQTLPAGAPRVDLSALKDVQDADYIRLRDAIQAHVIPFEHNAPRPAADQDRELDAVAAELRDLVRVARGLGFSVRVTIVGHADATGKDASNLALSLGRAEVVRSMLRARGIDPNLLAVRGAGPLEPLHPGASADEQSMNRRVSFTVGTSD